MKIRSCMPDRASGLGNQRACGLVRFHTCRLDRFVITACHCAIVVDLLLYVLRVIPAVALGRVGSVLPG